MTTIDKENIRLINQKFLKERFNIEISQDEIKVDEILEDDGFKCFVEFKQFEDRFGIPKEQLMEEFIDFADELKLLVKETEN